MVIVHGVTDDAKGLKVLRARESSLELGEVRPLEEGKPLQGDVVRLKPRPDAPFVCDVETSVSWAEVQKQAGVPALPSAAAAPRKTHPGPARVATDAYRANWDAIWSGPKKTSSDLN